MKAALKDALDDLPEAAYSNDQYAQVVETLFEHVYVSYAGEGQGKYSTTAAS